MTANAAIYLLKGAVLTTMSLSAISGTPAAATQRAPGGEITQFQIDLRESVITINVMPQERIAEHLNGFAGYIIHLTNGQPDTAAQALIQRILSTKQVLGLLIEPEWDAAGLCKRTVLGIAARYGGMVFADNAVFNAQGKYLIGAAESDQRYFLTG